MEKESWRLFLNICMQAKTEQELDALLEVLLTLEEIDSISKRCLIIQALLENKMTQREIAQKMGISVSKINRGSNALKRADQKIKQFLLEKLGEK